jgi:hypothetical protein
MKLLVLSLVTLGTLGIFRSSEAQVLEGTTDGDGFGWSVALAGDVNGDGLDDLLVGVPNRSGAGQNAGEVHLYLGRNDMFPSAPTLVIPGQSPGDEFGYAVSTAGDVNNDGYDDFLVGAPGRSAVALQAGRVYLFLGGSTPDGTPDQAWNGDIPQARFGTSVAGGFQFNGDDRSDFAAGAPGHNGGGLNAGRVRIFLGSPVSLATETYVLDGDQANWGLGQSLDPAGDVNSDGFDDLVAGAPQPLDQNSGRAVVWFGQSSSLGTPARRVFSGEVGTDQFGWDVSGAGDVNADGTDDLLVGAPRQGAENGAVYLFHGGDPMNTSFDWKTTGGTAGDRLGTAIDGGFDINGDGKPDFAAGAPGHNSLAAAAGEVRIYHGMANPNVDADSVLAPDAPVSSFEAGDEFGTSLRFAGSLDGHNSAELVAGAPTGNVTSGGEAGYINIITHSGDMTPVRLLGFEATRSSLGIELSWELAETSELAGLRVAVHEDGTLRNLHEGWLSSSTHSFLDAGAGTMDRSYRLSALDRVGGISVLGEIRIPGGDIALGLSPPDRNPFSDQVRLTLSTAGGRVQVFVSDVQGRQVRTLVDGYLPAGARNLIWDGRDESGSRVPLGMYVIWSRAGGRESSRKVMRMP